MKALYKKIIYNFKLHPYRYAFLTGCVYFSIVINWMFTIRTSEIAQGSTAKIVGLSAALIMLSSFACGFVFFIFIYRRLSIKLASRWSLLLIPAAWVLSEFLRAWFFSIVSLGPTGKIGAYWTYGNLGYIAGLTPFTFIGRLGGVYLLSFLVVLLIVAVIRMKRLKIYSELLIIIVVLSVTSFMCWFLYRQADGKTIDAGTFSYKSTQYPDVQSDEGAKLIKGRSITPLDLVVLPEYSGFFQEDSSSNDATLRTILKKNGLVIHSKKEPQESYNKNMLIFISPDGRVLNKQQKWFTIPSGEYIPYVYQVLLAYGGNEQLLLDFRNQKSVIPGNIREVPYTYDNVSHGALICSGITSPENYRLLVNEGASILTNSASLGSLGIKSSHHTQSQMMARRYAVDNARPFIQSAKDAPAFIYDHNGKLVAKASDDIAYATVTTNNKKTPYTRLGNWILIFSSIAILGRAMMLLLNERNKSKVVNNRENKK